MKRLLVNVSRKVVRVKEKDKMEVRLEIMEWERWKREQEGGGRCVHKLNAICRLQQQQ